jgi:hypothetical protein
MGMRILNKKLLSRLSTIYTIVVLGGFFIWAFSVQDSDGTLSLTEHGTTFKVFVALAILGVIMTGINFAGGVEKSSTKITRRTIMAGLTIGFGFLVWRILISIF